MRAGLGYAQGLFYVAMSALQILEAWSTVLICNNVGRASHVRRLPSKRNAYSEVAFLL